jgi:hypothetical protein
VVDHRAAGSAAGPGGTDSLLMRAHELDRGDAPSLPPGTVAVLLILRAVKMSWGCPSWGPGGEHLVVLPQSDLHTQTSGN